MKGTHECRYHLVSARDFQQAAAGAPRVILEDDAAVIKRAAKKVFTRTKRSARRLARVIAADGFAVSELHSDRTQPQRNRAMEGFRRGDFQVLSKRNRRALRVHLGKDVAAGLAALDRVVKQVL